MPPPATTPDGPHVVVLSFPFGTHAAPLLAVVKRLAALSPATHFSFFGTEQSNASAFKNQAAAVSESPNLRAHMVWNGIPEGYELTGRPQEAIEMFMKAAPGEFRKGIEAAVEESGRKVSWLVTDAFYWFASEMGIPWIAFWTAGPNSLSAHLHTDPLREALGSVPDAVVGREEETLKGIVAGMSKLRFRDLPEGVVKGNLQSIFSTMLHNMATHLPKAAAVFINSFHALDPTITDDLSSKLNNFLNIGPFHLLYPSPASKEQQQQPSDCISWLNDQRHLPASVAYLSFGSVVTPPPHELAAVAEALEASKVPFIWSLKEHSKAHLPDGFLDWSKGNGVVVPWAPQMEVLGHQAVGVFITHCGWNSVLESIAGGVPMICRPFFGDQIINSQMVEKVWEIGVNLEGGAFTKSGLVSCLDRVLRQEEGKKVRVNTRHLREKAEEATQSKGSSSADFFKLVELVSKST
uniref:Glycosyltransferase n=1 Tax=Linum usitatissimum TaxID=4006 RepID=I2BH76_LINUS|nr:UDP-glycosyltransferase 1 [Linum usitatissimum]